MTTPAPNQENTTGAWIFIGVVAMAGAWLIGSCQRNITINNCGRHEGEYIYSWRGTTQVVCVIKKGSDGSVEIVTRSGSGKGAFNGPYVVGEAGGRRVTCAGASITGQSYGICSD
jgi:hypothetical protein